MVGTEPIHALQTSSQQAPPLAQLPPLYSGSLIQTLPLHCDGRARPSPHIAFVQVVKLRWPMCSAVTWKQSRPTIMYLSVSSVCTPAHCCRGAAAAPSCTCRCRRRPVFVGSTLGQWPGEPHGSRGGAASDRAISANDVRNTDFSKRPSWSGLPKNRDGPDPHIPVSICFKYSDYYRRGEASKHLLRALKSAFH